MRFDSIYKSEPYFFEITKDNFEDGDQIVDEILKNASIASDNFNISFLASNCNHDVYRADSQKDSYCIKYSMDPKNSGIKREYDVVACLPNYCSPKSIYYNCKIFGETIHYSVLSFEKAFNLKNLGLSLLLDNTNEFFAKYNSLQQATTPLRNYNEHLNDFLNSIKLENFSEESLQAIESFSDINIIKETIKSIQEEIFALSDPKIVRKDSLCHGRLKASNILFKQGTFKFIDFTESYRGNVYLDLSAFFIYSGFNEEIKKSLLDEFIKSNRKTPCNQEYMEYEICYQISLRKIFLEILTDYLKEVYVFSSSRPMKITDCVDSFSKNAASFFRIPAVDKRKEFIYKCILEPILGI